MVRRTWLLCAVLVAGCAPGDPGLLIGGALSPSDTCVYDTSSIQLLSGVLDVAPALTVPPQPVRYSLQMLYFNQLLNLGQSGASGPPRADPNLIYVQQAEVELRDFNGTPLATGEFPNPYRVPATGIVQSSDGTAAGQGIGTVEIIPPFYASFLAGAVGSQVIAAVRAVGRTAGDAEVVSPEFEWPIFVCNGCLYACQRDAEGTPLCVPSCTPGQDVVTTTPGACEDPPIFGNCATGS